MEYRITLDRKAFKALSSDSRVAILKSLSARRKTLSELSSELGMSMSAMKQHMDSLVRAGLVEKKDDGHKWKYYELTKTGKNVVSHGDMRIFVMIGISAVAFIFTGYRLFSGRLFSYSTGLAEQSSMLDKEGSLAAPAMAPAVPDASFYMAGFILSALILFIGVSYAAIKRKNNAQTSIEAGSRA